MKIFKIDNLNNIEIVCDYAKTRNGFKHTATLLLNGIERENVKVNYLNRTWESYEYQTVLNKLIDNSKILTDQEKEKAKNYIKNYKEQNSFGALSAIMATANILTSDEKEKNEFKLRMLKAQFGDNLSLPDNWEQLSENEKTTRLENIEKVLKEI
jgi:hypothetical protein